MIIHFIKLINLVFTTLLRELFIQIHFYTGSSLIVLKESSYFNIPKSQNFMCDGTSDLAGMRLKVSGLK